VSEGQRRQWRYRSVVVKDKPDALRPYRWSIEKRVSRDWRFIRTGRAFSYAGALRKAARKGILCPEKVERTELEVVTLHKPEEIEPTPATNPLPPTLLSDAGEANQ
jgi:hypothetical protein